MNQLNTKVSQIVPERESDFHRTPELGYEHENQVGFIRYLEHGSPNPLIRWHYHDEYELHLITATSGKMFVGDYIGQFKPGNLCLTGPNLPHNWISTDSIEEGVALRDKVILFSGEPLRKSVELMPELKQILSLLDDAKLGVEFTGITDEVEDLMNQIKLSFGIDRLALFIKLLGKLADRSNYRMLSSVQLQIQGSRSEIDLISKIVDFISDNYGSSFSMAEIAQQFGMSESRFSRFFRRRTGNTFTDFVNRLRVNKASQLLLETDKYISTICYEVGFNNVANFNRRFMEIRGMTPTEFRRNGLLRY